MPLHLAIIAAAVAQASAAPFCDESTPTFSASLASLEESRLAHWYIGTLGFKSVHTVYSVDGDTIHVLTCGPLVLTIGPAREGANSADRSGEGIGEGIFAIGWTVGDFAAAHKRLEDGKVAIDYGPVSNSFGQRMLMFQDPDGNRLEITDPTTPMNVGAAR